MESSQPQGGLTTRDRWIALALGVATMLVAAATSRFYGMTWDEGYYYPTFEDVVAWVKLLASSPGLALSAEGIEAGWGQIEELPPLTKWIGALCVALTPAGWELEAVRAYAFVLFGATVGMLYAAARRRASMPFALGAALPQLRAPPAQSLRAR